MPVLEMAPYSLVVELGKSIISHNLYKGVNFCIYEHFGYIISSKCETVNYTNTKRNFYQTTCIMKATLKSNLLPSC